MKIRLIATFCAFSLAVTCSASVHAAVNSATCSRLILTGHPSYPPVAWAANGTLDGAGIALVRRLAKDAGVSISVVNEGSWDAAQAAVRDGKADAIVGIYLTAARAKIFDYVQPAFATDPSAVVTLVGAHFAYANSNSLIGKRGVAGTGESFGKSFDAFLKEKLTVQRVDGFDAIYRSLEQKQADYGLVGYYPALTGAPKNVKIVAPNVVTENFYIAFGKSSPCSATLSPKFSKDIARLVADGTIKHMMATALKSYSK